jgi:copper(I)-binding protein
MLYCNTKTVIRFFSLFSVLVLFSSNLYAHSNHIHSKKPKDTLNTHKDTRAIHVKHARVNPIFAGMPVTAAYFTLRNKSDKDITLVAVSGSISERIEIHEHTMENGLMKMQEVVDGVVLPAGKKIRFKPGGHHIMIMDVNQDIKEGDIVELTLEFTDGSKQMVKAKAIKPSMDHSQDSGHHGDHHKKHHDKHKEMEDKAE